MPKKKIPEFTEEFRKLLLEVDFEYFLNEHLLNSMAPEEIPENKQLISKTYKQKTREVQERYKRNRKQCRLWLEGFVRLQWYGGMLPAQFRLDGHTRELSLMNFEQLGNEWAWFAYWQKLERRRKLLKLSWDRITKIGAILAITLSLLKLIEAFGGS